MASGLIAESYFMRKLGLIAGNGKFPLIFAEQAKLEGVSLVAVAHRGETPKAIEKVVEAVMAGGIQKVKLFSNFRPDLRGAAFLARMKSREDDQLLRGVAGELEGEGIRVLESTLFLSQIMPPKGVLTRRSPTPQQWEDIRIGFETAKEVGRLGVGQTVVVKNRVVLAIEAVEGTDAAIRRGGVLGKKGFV